MIGARWPFPFVPSHPGMDGKPCQCTPSGLRRAVRGLSPFCWHKVFPTAQCKGVKHAKCPEAKPCIGHCGRPDHQRRILFVRLLQALFSRPALGEGCMTLVRVDLPGDTTMIEIREHAEQHGLVLITDGHELAYTLPHHIPLGWRRFVLVDKETGKCPG